MRRWALAAVAACSPAVMPPVVEIPPPPPAQATPAPQGPFEQDSPPPQEVETPFATGQGWLGQYVCAQGETRLALVITRVAGLHVVAIFNFTHEPSGTEGSYDVEGDFEPRTGRTVLKPGKWRDQPSGYVSVGLSGTVSGEVFQGRIDYPGCGAFSVKLGAGDDRDED